LTTGAALDDFRIAFDGFVKQSYRNRCCILSPNGLQCLSIPLIKAKKRQIIKDIRISYAENWRKIHWKSFEAAYRRSPYFEFYEDEFYPFYHEKEITFLLDFNQLLNQKLIELLGLNTTIIQSKRYINPTEVDKDYRILINRKNKIDNTIFTEYTQVFSDRNGFKPNLSIIDLLFNEGPNALIYLKEVSK